MKVYCAGCGHKHNINGVLASVLLEMSGAGEMHTVARKTIWGREIVVIKSRCILVVVRQMKARKDIA